MQLPKQNIFLASEKPRSDIHTFIIKIVFASTINKEPG
jgi:hypothetical protein